MANRILGPEGSPRRSRFRFIFVPALLAAVVALVLAGGAQAVHDLKFELDGNVTTQGSTPFGTGTFDWESFFNASGSSSPALPALSRPGFTNSAFTRDFGTNADGSFDTSDSTTFTTGSKDTLNINTGWECTPSNNVNSKTDLSNVYALAYTDPLTNHQILYFGLERNDNSGDGNIAFWFLQDNANCVPPASGKTAWTGVHRDGDILVVSAFTNGGTVSTIDAYRWNINAGTPPGGSLGTTPVAHGVDCTSPTTTAGDSTCATSNRNTITTPWLTTRKTNPGTEVGHTLNTSEFFEGGLDLTLSNLAGKCFSTFLGDTRTSQSLTSTIFDYARGSFEHCAANISITPNGVNEIGHTHTFTVHVTQSFNGQPTPVANVKPTVTLTATGGAVVANKTDNCATTGTNANGDCTVTFTSNSVGTVSGHAAVTVSNRGTDFPVQTDGQNGNSGDAVKAFVDANVSIAPNGVNEVGHQHVFTISTTALPGAGTTASLTSITPHVSPAPGSISDTCANPTVTGSTATCTVTISSNDPGVFTATADAVWHFTDGANSADVTRTTDSTHGSSGPAIKRFVDANVSITPNGVNEVGHQHVFTISTTAIPAGTTATLTSLTPQVSPAPGSITSTCAVPTVAGNTATCTVTINSNDPGTFTANATAVWHFAGAGAPSSADVTRTTDATHGSSGPAVKHFVDANVSIAPNGVNEVGHQHVFTISTTALPGGSTASLTSITPHVSPAPGSISSTCASPTVTGNTATCTVTINNNDPGTFTATADAVWHFTDGTNSTDVTRTTNSTHGSSGPAVKHFVDANVSISPNGVNEVGHEHVFTISTTALPSGTTATLTSITPHVSPAPDSISDTCGSPVVNGNTATCTVTISSDEAGVFTATADAVWHFSDGSNSTNVTRTTDTTHGSSGSAVKRFVDANVSISPNGVNEVGHEHVFTISTTALPAGTTASLTAITPHVSPAPGSISSTCGSPTVTGNTATCTVTINSNDPGTFTATADAVWHFTDGTNSTDVTRTTDSTHGSSGPAVKHFVDANVSIAPSAVNEVKHQHVFTISTTAFPAGTTATLTSITPHVSPAPDSISDTCANPVVNGNTATCTLTINNNTAAVFTATADAVWHFTDGTNSTDVSRTTDTTHGSSGPATKRFVDAFITITPPEATNSVGDQHTFVVSVSQDDGLPANAPGGDAYTGFAPPPDGTPVTVTLTNHDGANFKLILDTCAPPNGTTAGTCTVTFSSPTAGTVTGHASVTFDIGGVTLTRETDGIAPNSGDAIKHFAAGSVRWTKVDNAGDPLAGATFELCRTYDFDFVINKISTTPLDSPVCVTVEDNGSTDADPADGHFLVSNLPLGEYTVRETQAPPGFVLDPLPQTVDLIPGHINEAVANAFVNSRPVLKITGFGYTNQPDGPSPHGVFKGTTTYTVMLHNFGTAAAVLTSSSLVVSDNATCTGGNTLVIVGTVSAGFDSVPISLTCTYDTPNPTAITATLTVKYTTNGLERTASGSPAEITFTVNPD